MRKRWYRVYRNEMKDNLYNIRGIYMRYRGKGSVFGCVCYPSAGPNKLQIINGVERHVDINFGCMHYEGK